MYRIWWITTSKVYNSGHCEILNNNYETNFNLFHRHHILQVASCTASRNNVPVHKIFFTMYTICAQWFTLVQGKSQFKFEKIKTALDIACFYSDKDLHKRHSIVYDRGGVCLKMYAIIYFTFLATSIFPQCNFYLRMAQLLNSNFQSRMSCSESVDQYVWVLNLIFFWNI